MSSFLSVIADMYVHTKSNIYILTGMMLSSEGFKVMFRFCDFLCHSLPWWLLHSNMYWDKKLHVLTTLLHQEVWCHVWSVCEYAV